MTLAAAAAADTTDSVKLEAQWKWNHHLLNFYYTPARHLHKKKLFLSPTPLDSTKNGRDLLVSWFSTLLYFLWQLFYVMFFFIKRQIDTVVLIRSTKIVVPNNFHQIEFDFSIVFLISICHLTKTLCSWFVTV